MMMLSPHKQISNDTWIGHIIRFLYKFLQHKTKKKIIRIRILRNIRNQKPKKKQISHFIYLSYKCTYVSAPYTQSKHSERASEQTREREFHLTAHLLEYIYFTSKERETKKREMLTNSMQKKWK